eukprot:EG_transcript_10484
MGRLNAAVAAGPSSASAAPDAWTPQAIWAEAAAAAAAATGGAILALWLAVAPAAGRLYGPGLGLPIPTVPATIPLQSTGTPAPGPHFDRGEPPARLAVGERTGRQPLVAGVIGAVAQGTAPSTVLAALATLATLAAFLCRALRGGRHSPSPLAPMAMAAATGGPFSSKRTVPRDIKETLAQLRESVQRALENRQSRMDVELPAGSKFGVESDDKAKGPQLIQRSDRELARIFVEMFQPIGDSLLVAFPDDRQAAAAREKWPSVAGKVVSLTASSKRPKTGFGAKSSPAEKATPSVDPAVGLRQAEVILVVAPTPETYDLVESISKERGNNCCIILLNARLHQATFANAKQGAYLRSAFKPVFHLRPLLAKDGGVNGVDGILLHTYPEGWLVARKPRFGPPVVLLESPDAPPPPEDVRRALQTEDQPVGAVLNSVKSLFGGK